MMKSLIPTQNLKSKHPGATLESTLQGMPSDVHPVIFDSIDASLIKSVALRTGGTAGPSGLDAFMWRRLCTSFKKASRALCNSLALTAKRLCSEIIVPLCVSHLLACRLIALDKTQV